MRTSLFMALFLITAASALAQDNSTGDSTTAKTPMQGTPELPLKQTPTNNRPGDADAKSVDKKGGVGGKNSDNNGG